MAFAKSSFAPVAGFLRVLVINDDFDAETFLPVLFAAL